MTESGSNHWEPTIMVCPGPPPKDAGPVIMVFCNKDKTEAEYSWNREVISGVYYAIGEFGGRKIYEKSVEDPNKMWWSLRFDAENNRWISSYSDSKIVIGNELQASLKTMKAYHFSNS